MAATFAAAAVGAAASSGAPEFYHQLTRPSWAPRTWLFGPVWTALYLLMAIAVWMIWSEQESRLATIALGLFLIQLAVNALWSWTFFAWRLGGGSFAEIVLLLALIVATVIAFWRVRPIAAVLMLPYVIWVSFALALNFVLWQSNPELLAAINAGHSTQRLAGLSAFSIGQFRA